jgi:hypothetical protein
MAETNATIDAWRRVGEAGDAAAAVACMAPDIVAISPLTERFRFHGREQVGNVMAAAFETIHGIRYHTVVGEGDTWAVFFHARAGREPVEEAELIRLDADGLIRELTFFGRPLPALTAVMAGIGPRLMRRQGNPRLGRFVGLAVRPLAAMTRFGDRRIVPAGDPNRRRSPN